MLETGMETRVRTKKEIKRGARGEVEGRDEKIEEDKDREN